MSDKVELFPQTHTTSVSPLKALLAPELDPLFWQPKRLGVQSAWWKHVPFAMWLTVVAKPKVIVELGTHNGVSYAGFCEGVQLGGLATRCYAVDTWAGDAHAGAYDQSVYNDFAQFHAEAYSGFSEMIRASFDDALPYFEDGTVDILHIDGYHTFEAVKHDFETWMPKLSDRAVVLFHDTNVKRDNFGVWQFWAQVKTTYPCFEFLHGHGLGVLAYGARAPETVLEICALVNQADIATLRNRFATLGERWFDNLQKKDEILGLAKLLSQKDHEIALLTGQSAERQREYEGMKENLETNWHALFAAKEHEWLATLDNVKAEQLKVITAKDHEPEVAISPSHAESDLLLHQANATLNALSDRYAGESRARRKTLLSRLMTPWSKKARKKKRQIAIIENSLFFDAKWYIKTYALQDVQLNRAARHYFQQGVLDRMDPGPHFSTRGYLEKYPGVAASSSNPLVHFEKFGRAKVDDINCLHQAVAKRNAESDRHIGESRTRSKTFVTRLLSLWSRKASKKKHQIVNSILSSRKEKGFGQLAILSAKDIFCYGLEAASPVPLLRHDYPIKSNVRLVAFYLPQFHPIEENDKWWGKGFTEWTNVTRAVPQFSGHYQPHLPGELGFYDLRNPAVQRRQAELATLYGISAFCIYFYWFDGTVLLERPLLNLLENIDIDQQFCLCWANENWTRTWDGLENDILLGQKYSPEDDIRFIEHISKYLLDGRYMRIGGKPVLIVYRPQLLPSMIKTAARWRDWCRNNGIGEIYIICTHSFGTIKPSVYGCDAAVQFPPNNTSPTKISHKQDYLNLKFNGQVYDFSEFVSRSFEYTAETYKLFRSVCPMWDNEARKPGKGSIWINSTPSRYCQWLTNAAIDASQFAKDPDERLVFVNAWNEWAEGAHLEPDRRHGYAYLEATRVALTRAHCIAEKNKIKEVSPKIAIVIHIYYLDVMEEIVDSLDPIDSRHHIFVTTVSDNEAKVRQFFYARNLPHTIFVFKNIGRDVFPFLRALKIIDPDTYPVILKLHTKKSTHRKDGDKWRLDSLNSLAAPQQLAWIAEQMVNDTSIGIVGTQGHVIPMTTFIGSNREKTNWLAERLGISDVEWSSHGFIAGTMFVARRSALEPILNLAISESDFEAENGQLDGTMAHAIERAFTFSALSVGLEIGSTGARDAEKSIPISKSKSSNFEYARASVKF